MTAEGRTYAVDSSRCIGCAACSSLAPGVFRTEHGLCRVRRQALPEEDGRCRAAIFTCPTRAIHRARDDAPGAVDLATADDRAPRDLHTELAAQAEGAPRWALAGVPWNELDAAAVSSELRGLVREMAFSENATYSATQRFLQTFYDDVAFSQWISVWFYEETRHPQVLMEWLARVGDPEDDDFVRRGRVSTPFMKSKMGTLVTNVVSEIAASHAYAALAGANVEPVLTAIARRISGDEARHASAFFRFARDRLERAERPERERLDGLKVLHLWLTGRDQVSHPVNQMLKRLEPAAPAGTAGSSPVPDVGFESGALARRVTRLVGLLLDVNVREPGDVEAAVRDLVARVHSA